MPACAHRDGAVSVRGVARGSARGAKKIAVGARLRHELADRILELVDAHAHLVDCAREKNTQRVIDAFIDRKEQWRAHCGQ